MADEINKMTDDAKRIKQLENQNLKFKRLLAGAEGLSSEDSARMAQLKTEAENLTETIQNLEQKKEKLKNEILDVLVGEKGEIMYTLNKLEAEHVELQSKLELVLYNINNEKSEIEHLKMEDMELKKALNELEEEKSTLLEKLKLIGSEDVSLPVEVKEEENIALQETLTQLENKKSSLIKLLARKEMKEFASEETVLSNLKSVERSYMEYVKADEGNSLGKKISNIETRNEELFLRVKESNSENVPNQNEVNEAIIQSNTDLLERIKQVKAKLSAESNEFAEFSGKIAKLEKEKEKLYEEIEVSLESSTKEIQKLKENIEDPAVKHLVNEIEIQKGILLYNLKLLRIKEETKPSTDDTSLPEVPNHEITIRSDDECPSTSAEQSEEKMGGGSSQIQHGSTMQSYEERQLQTQSELHNTFMREMSSERVVGVKNMDDATNQLISNEIAERERMELIEQQPEQEQPELQLLEQQQPEQQQPEQQQQLEQQQVEKQQPEQQLEQKLKQQQLLEQHDPGQQLEQQQLGQQQLGQQQLEQQQLEQQQFEQQQLEQQQLEQQQLEKQQPEQQLKQQQSVTSNPKLGPETKSKTESKIKVKELNIKQKDSKDQKVKEQKGKEQKTMDLKGTYLKKKDQAKTSKTDKLEEIKKKK